MVQLSKLSRKASGAAGFDGRTVDGRFGGSRWYVAQTWPHGEYRARDWLLRFGWADGFGSEHGRVWLPECEVVRRVRRCGPILRAKLPLFPGYLFVLLDAAEEAVPPAPTIDGLLSVDGRPAAVPWDEISELQARIAAGGGMLRIVERFAVGDTVRVAGGAWAGWQGLYVASVNGRLKILLDMFGRATETLVPEALVEPA